MSFEALKAKTSGLSDRREQDAKVLAKIPLLKPE
jgi:hypothetical protein